MSDKDLEWADERRTEVENRILDLEDEQIADLFGKVGITFPNTPMQKVIDDIRRNEHHSTDLDILMREASSKDKLMREIGRFKDERELAVHTAASSAFISFLGPSLALITFSSLPKRIKG